ncbi:uncharacterized protein Nmag_4270 (plasmid) [Natrialba magadii ATCC 43099]|uniref:HNH nuclease n=2 Tax=root TaxID=1 RepID=D3T2G9_NATMM|nr:helix-turn-helix domain-containing protein [Natrialba magadii]ADD07778.1 uncharacterized protein Nmag_4270 [Natrialba magadii ATCC 43099]ELY23025.1 HNH nuclease [Natrialba magadii ATCC 43099]
MSSHHAGLHGGPPFTSTCSAKYCNAEYSTPPSQSNKDNKYCSKECRTSGAWRDEEVMEALYLLRGMSVSQIGDYLGCSGQTVWRWLDEHGIEARQASEPKYPRISSKDWLVKTYVEKNMTSGEIAEWVGCSSGVVWEWCQRHGIDCQENGSWPRGEDHHLYGGGDIKYGEGWNKKKKERVRERDGRECQHCGRGEQEHVKLFGTKHIVHHVVPARSIEDAQERNAMKNLVTLCRGDCHKRWEEMAPLRPITSRVEVRG